MLRIENKSSYIWPVMVIERGQDLVIEQDTLCCYYPTRQRSRFFWGYGSELEQYLETMPHLEGRGLYQQLIQRAQMAYNIQMDQFVRTGIVLHTGRLGLEMINKAISDLYNKDLEIGEK